jgi:hypothetical protein
MKKRKLKDHGRGSGLGLMLSIYKTTAHCFLCSTTSLTLITYSVTSAILTVALVSCTTSTELMLIKLLTLIFTTQLSLIPSCMIPSMLTAAFESSPMSTLLKFTELSCKMTLTAKMPSTVQHRRSWQLTYSAAPCPSRC